jgi:hypothetical protein
MQEVYFMDLYKFAQNIIGELTQIKCPDDNKVNLWTAITLQVSAGGTCFGQYVDIIQKVISQNLTKLDGETIKAIWEETETGAINSDDVEHVPIDYLSFMLETEILDEVMKLTSEDVEE